MQHDQLRDQRCANARRLTQHRMRAVSDDYKWELDFSIGDLVCHRVSLEQRRGLVIGYSLRPNRVLYFVEWDDGPPYAEAVYGKESLQLIE